MYSAVISSTAKPSTIEPTMTSWPLTRPNGEARR